MEIKEEEAQETFFQAIYEKIGKATYDWTPQDFLEFLQIIDFTQIKSSLQNIKTFKKVKESNFKSYNLTKIMYRKVFMWKGLLKQYDTNFNFDLKIPSEYDNESKKIKIPLGLQSNLLKEEEEEKINYDAKETCILIEYLMDNSQYPIPKEGGKFGRHIDNDIVLYDKDVSRKHAEIFYLDNKFWLKDLKSSIGTLIQIKEPIILENMIKIEIGNIYKITLEKISKKKLKIRIANEDDENEKVQEIDFGSNSKKIKIFLGQAQNCQIKLISKKKIEDYHCKIYINDDEEMVLEDLNSEIGTWMFLDQIPKELKRGMLFKLGEQNIFVVKQVFIIQKTNVHLLTDSEETKGFKDTDEDLCIICCVSPKNGALLPCKHNFMCVKCSKGLKICPICRTEIKSVLEIKQ